MLAVIVVLLVAGRASGFSVPGPDPARPIRQMRHDSWNESSGLSGSVYSLAQTTDGFLWIGTSTGLYRFDGMKFEPYLEFNEDQPVSEVSALLPTGDGGLWIGYRDGVAFLKQDVATVYTAPQGLPYGRVTSLAQTGDGAIWAAVTLSGGEKAGAVQASVTGLARLSHGRWEKIGPAWNYPEKSAGRVIVDGAGTLWVTGGESVHFLPRGTRTFQETGLKVSTWTQVCAGPDGSIWLADPVAHTILHFPVSLLHDHVTVSGEPLQGIYAIRFDHARSFWMATDRGVFRVGPGLIGAVPTVTTDDIEKDSFRAADGLSSAETNALLQDREGNIWVGTTNGLDRFSERSATRINLGHTPSDLITGPRSEVWASQFGASPLLIPLHDAKPYPLSVWFTRSFYMDRRGTLWAAMQSDASWQSRALWKDDKGDLTRVTSPPGVNGPLIDGIVGDAHGRLWLTISGYGEYTLDDEGRWEKIPVFSGNEATIAPDAQFLDASGRAWLEYYTHHAVVMVDGTRRTFFTPGHGLELGRPLAGGASGSQVWISGTDGLGFFDGKEFQIVRAADGSTFANASVVIPTQRDGLWLKGPSGVTQIPAHELAARYRDHAHSVRYRRFDGSTDFVTPLAPSRRSASDTGAVVSGDGKLWFAVHDGVAMIDPAHLARNEIPPPVFIRNLTANGRSLSAYHDVTLPQSTTAVSLGYTALSLTLSDRNRFRYQLLGMDKGWTDAGTRRQAFYTNLKPGTYTFKVIAANNDGVWNETGAAITFRIPPTFFQTIWFQILLAVVFAALLWFLFLIRLHQHRKRIETGLRERVMERERIARELHDTLLQGFEMLVLRFQVITDNMAPDNPSRVFLEDSLSRSEQTLKEGRERVSALRTEAESGEDLVEDLRKFGENLAQESTTTFQLRVEGTPTTLRSIVHEEVRMIAREAMANAFHHAEATSIDCRIIFTRRHFMFVCADDGCGIAKAVSGSGNIRNHWGLVGMQERARKIGAILHMGSGEHRGTSIELKLRADMAYAKRMQSLFFRRMKPEPPE
ncbi:sensor histidine kinase [Rhodanobacter glycinis]|uniref:sensor histidine kinase n=1 Tax=Rhodanobacter glycinis TaxID=582702 RepID=UPI001375D199|nr:sensor histidine kinase [Rhodanobacter glycinis]